uniref:Ethanolaminephosphotransferase n=1 Tax=Haptolina brevifila TaxID=156173 RepID=A0A7S2FSD6_9EUKA
MRAAVCRYKYRAPALSLLERLFLDDFWALLANRVYPRWLAPNLLTISGGACIAVATVLTLVHSPWLQGNAPAWVYGANAALLLCYQTLDGSDGKQARKTASGSPVGEILDHGLDAYAVGCITTMCTDAFAFGLLSPWPWLVLVGAQSAFFASNLTLIHHGRMRVDSISVIELQMAMGACLCATAAWTPALWLTRLWGVELRVLLGAGTVIAMASSAGTGAWDALCSPSSDTRGAVWRQCASCVAYVVIVGIAFASLVQQPDASSVAVHMLLLMLCSNSCFAEFMARLLLLRLAEWPVHLCWPGLAFLASFAAIVQVRGGGLGASVCAILAAVAALSHAHFFVWAVRSMAAALGVQLFRVKGARSWCRL